MKYWQIKVPMRDWAEGIDSDEYENLKVGNYYIQKIKDRSDNPRNNIGDIVFIHNNGKNNITKKYPRGIYLVCKILTNMNKQSYISLQILKDLRRKPFDYAKSFPDIDDYYNTLNIRKRVQNPEEIDLKYNPQKLYDLIMKKNEHEILAEKLYKKDIRNLTEGEKKQITVNTYERSPQARQKCIEKYGTKCSVCNFDFEQKYGKIGKDFIHVHHLTTISSIAENYEVNPIEDLRPVCPNCHAMLHKKQPEPYTINELKEIIKNNIVTTIEIKFSGHSGSFNNAMIMHGEAKFHQENINKLISKCKSIDEVMEILKQYFEEKQPKHCTDITATIDGDIFSIKKDLTSYEQISI